MKNEVIKVNGEDIIVEGRQLGATFNPKTLYNYVSDGCVDEPERGAGYGGKWAIYKESDIIWAVVTWRMIHGVYPVLKSEIPGDFEADIDIKIPRMSPKTIGFIREEFMKRFSDYVKTNTVFTLDSIETKVYSTCWQNKYGTLALVLRGMTAWYICALKYAIQDLASLNAENNQTDVKIEIIKIWNRLADEAKLIKGR